MVPANTPLPLGVPEAGLTVLPGQATAAVPLVIRVPEPSSRVKLKLIVDELLAGVVPLPVTFQIDFVPLAAPVATVIAPSAGLLEKPLPVAVTVVLPEPALSESVTEMLPLASVLLPLGGVKVNPQPEQLVVGAAK